MLVRLITICLWVVAGILPANVALAESHFETSPEPEPAPEPVPEREIGPDTEENTPSGLFNSQTNAVVGSLARAKAECDIIPLVFRFDCLRQKYRSTASRLEDNSGYKEPLDALRSVEDALYAIVAENADPAVPSIQRNGKTYRAITPASTASATAAYNLALSDASTVLLRSASDNAQHFTRIAQALDSNKILLRSALLLLFQSPNVAECRSDNGWVSQVI